MLPGMHGTGDLFDQFLPLLEENIRPIVVAYPENKFLNYTQLTELVRWQLPEDEPFVLLAESFSGPVAIAIAAARPRNLVGVILCCSFVRNPTPHLWPLKFVSGLIPVRPHLMWLAAPVLLGHASSLKTRNKLKMILERISPEVLRGRMHAVLEVDYSGDLLEIQVPILYLQALHDHIVPSSAMRTIARLMPNVETVTLNGPHMLLQAIPDAVASSVNRFVRHTQVDPVISET